MVTVAPDPWTIRLVTAPDGTNYWGARWHKNDFNGTAFFDWGLELATILLGRIGFVTELSVYIVGAAAGVTMTPAIFDDQTGYGQHRLRTRITEVTNDTHSWTGKWMLRVRRGDYTLAETLALVVYFLAGTFAATDDMYVCMQGYTLPLISDGPPVDAEPQPVDVKRISIFGR